jgi:branched-chain amino acid aminotransferase
VLLTHYVNGTFVQEPTLSAFDLGLLRGYGVFDYVRVYQGHPFHLNDHLKRLLHSASALHIPLGKTVEELATLTHLLLEQNPSIEAGLRFIATGGTGAENPLIPSSQENLIILLEPYTPPPAFYYTKGMRACLSTTLRSLPSIKTTNYIPAVLGMQLAQQKGFDDALYLSPDNTLLEATTSNLFFFKGDTLITAEDNILKGITRAVFLSLAEDEFPIEYRALHLDELPECTEAFLTSSNKEGVPLVAIENHPIANGTPGPHTQHLLHKFQNYKKELVLN